MVAFTGVLAYLGMKIEYSFAEKNVKNTRGRLELATGIFYRPIIFKSLMTLLICDRYKHLVN